jgi:nucleoid-associated protein YgaU
MQKDFKIGLIVGVAFVVVAGLWLATRPSLGPQARMQRQQGQAEKENLGAGLATQPNSQFSSEPVPMELPNAAGQSATNTATSQAPQYPIGRAEMPSLTVYEKPQKIKTQRFYIVRQGDSLSTISQQFYGSPNSWRKIVDANRQVIKDANKIKPGTRLIIPD